jgi:hypothetical protein
MLPKAPSWVATCTNPSFSSTRSEAAFTSSTPAKIGVGQFFQRDKLFKEVVDDRTDAGGARTEGASKSAAPPTSPVVLCRSKRAASSFENRPRRVAWPVE